MIGCPVCGLALFRTGAAAWWCTPCGRAWEPVELVVARAVCLDCGARVAVAPWLLPTAIDAPRCAECQAKREGGQA